jgi:hypothetical protein
MIFCGNSRKHRKITVNSRGDTTYIQYMYARKYAPKKKYNDPQRVTIGKQSNRDSTMMQPNQNSANFFPGVELPDERNNSNRSS